MPIYFSQFPGGQKSNFVKKDNNRKHKINAEIKGTEFRVVDQEGGMLGVMSRQEALRVAEDADMDLVEIAPQAKPPVVKVIDYGKFAYEIQKKEKIQKKNQHQQLMKEIRFKWRTDTHDFNFKTKHAREFLNDGNKVKGLVMFRGREITHKEIGISLLEKFVEELKDISKIDSQIRFEGKNLTVILAPDKIKKEEKKPEKGPKTEKPKVSPFNNIVLPDNIIIDDEDDEEEE
ncbi:MAG: translation initiation factor IF-3 [Candidatus Kapaibacteriota bacterium]|jgi:translation initiation factor IF-3